MLAELLDTGGSDRHPDLPSPADVVVGAVPLFVTAGDTGTGADADLGWLALLERTDELACRCVREALDWDGGASLPFGAARTHHHHHHTHRCGMGPRADRRAAHRRRGRRLHPRRPQRRSGRGPRRQREPRPSRPPHPAAAVPRRLFTASPLAELILDASHTIWVRYGDQTVYLAPQ